MVREFYLNEAVTETRKEYVRWSPQQGCPKDGWLSCLVTISLDSSTCVGDPRGLLVPTGLSWLEPQTEEPHQGPAPHQRSPHWPPCAVKLGNSPKFSAPSSPSEGRMCSRPRKRPKTHKCLKSSLQSPVPPTTYFMCHIRKTGE